MNFDLKYVSDLLTEKKLILICDMDETLLSSVCVDAIDIDVNRKDLYKMEFPEQKYVSRYYLKKRPYLDKFLSSMNEIFELHLMSAGSKDYVHKCINIIDPNKKYFGNRITTREDFIYNSKAETARQMFPGCEKMVMCLDDRSSNWGKGSSLIQIKPYLYFQKMEYLLEYFHTFNYEEETTAKKFIMELLTSKDNDNNLYLLQKVFEHVHEEYFKELKKCVDKHRNFDNLPDVRVIIEKQRQNILNKSIIYVSREYNEGKNKLIEKLGGQEVETFSSDVTLVVTDKCDSKMYGKAKVVNEEWILDLYYKWEEVKGKTSSHKRFLKKINKHSFLKWFKL